MWLDLKAVALASDRRVVTPTGLTNNAKIPAADAEAMADKVSDWWETHLKRELWANTWEARVPGLGIQRIGVPRWPVWDDPPVVTPISNEVAGIKYTATTYRVVGRCRNMLYRQLAWPWTAPVTGGMAEFPASGLEDPSLRIGPDPDDATVTGFRAGFVMPGEIATWTASTTWGVGASTSYSSGTSYGWARASDRTNRFLYEVTSGSGAESTEPTWPTTDGATVTGANVTFTAREFAQELPRVYVSASYLLARKIRQAEEGGKCVEDEDCATVLKMVHGAC